MWYSWLYIMCHIVESINNCVHGPNLPSKDSLWFTVTNSIMKIAAKKSQDFSSQKFVHSIVFKFIGKLHGNKYIYGFSLHKTIKA